MMLQLLLILLVFYPSSYARAACAEVEAPDLGRWVQDSERSAEYRSERELEQFLEKNRSNFPDTKASELEYATERLMNFHWEGKSSCKTGDARLRLEYDAGEVKFKRDEPPITSLPLHERTSDPCELACMDAVKVIQTQ